MMPTSRSLTTLISPKLTSAALPLVSPMTAMRMTMAKKMIKQTARPTDTECPFTFLKINGRLPAISPQNAKFVGIG